jgi:hypothetical protein
MTLHVGVAQAQLAELARQAPPGMVAGQENIGRPVQPPAIDRMRFVAIE